MSQSEILIQWDPDHAPDGSKLERRAIQIGLRGSALKELSEEALLEVIDMSSFVDDQRPNAVGDFSKLSTPREHVYIPQQI